MSAEAILDPDKFNTFSRLDTALKGVEASKELASATETLVKSSPSAGQLMNVGSAIGQNIGGVGGKALGAIASYGAISGMMSKGAGEAAKTATTATKGAAKGASFNPAAAGITAGLMAADLLMQSKGIDRAEASQMRIIAEQHGIAVEDLEGNANIRRTVQSAGLTRNLMSRMEQLEKMKNTGGIQRQQFLPNEG